jgi:drug/metabolite transporter (DMT)-like permease
MNGVLKAHLSLLTANLIYAATFTIAKWVTPEYIRPFGLVLLRGLGATPMFWIMGFLFVKEKTERKDIPKFALLSVFGVVINQLLFVKGLSITSPISAAIMMITTPILVLLIAGLLIKEKITPLKLAGVITGFAGAAMLMASSNHTSVNSDNATGDLLIFTNALSWGTYLVLVKPFMKKYHTITILRWVFLFGLLMVFPFGFRELSEVKWNEFTANTWFFTCFIVVAATFIAYLLNVYALKALSPSVVSAYIYLQPLLATVIALAAGSDRLNMAKIISAFLIFGGVYLVSRNRKTSTS